MEQLRTEAEKFYKEYVKDKGQGAITLNVIDIMMAFHAQQSKDREWISVTEKYPDEKQTVWCYSEKLDNVFLGEYVYVMNEGWFWAESNGVIYASDGKIVTECEMDDFDVSHWFPAPFLPNKSTLTK